MPTDAEGKDTFQTDKSCLQSKTVHSGFVSILLINYTLQSKDRRVAFWLYMEINLEGQKIFMNILEFSPSRLISTNDWDKFLKDVNFGLCQQIT